MSAFEIELNIEQQGSGYFTASPTLSGQTYALKFRWSVRSNAWFLDIDDTIHGIKIVNGIDILGPYHYNDLLPPGKLGAHRNQGTSSKPGFFNFGIGKEVTFRYEEP